MAPEIPFNDPKKPDGEDKFVAAIFAMFLIAFGIVGIFITISLITALWHIGFINSLVIVGAFSGLFAIGRALYHTILEKDIL